MGLMLHYGFALEKNKYDRVRMKLRSNLNPKNPIDLVSDFLPKTDSKLVEETKNEV